MMAMICFALLFVVYFSSSKAFKFTTEGEVSWMNFQDSMGSNRSNLPSDPLGYRTMGAMVQQKPS